MRTRADDGDKPEKKIKMPIIGKRRTRGVLLPKYWQISGFVRPAMRFRKEASSECIHS